MKVIHYKEHRSGFGNASDELDRCFEQLVPLGFRFRPERLGQVRDAVLKRRNEPREFTTERPQLEAEVLEGTDRGVGPKGFRDRLVGKAQFLVAGAVEDSRSFLVHRTGEL